MKLKVITVLFFLIMPALTLFAQQKAGNNNRLMKDDNSKFTNIGNIGITITNFGTYGHGFSLWPNQPSCEYPKGSGIEHIFDGGLWIGGFKANDSLGNGKTGPFVTTGAVDASSVAARGGGFEWTNAAASKVIERSSLVESKFFSPEAISHQDFVADYIDTNTVLENGEVIVEHTPLGVAIRQETYAWNFPFADFMVIFNYWVKNVSGKYLDSVYVGLWTDAVVRNTKITSPGGSSFFNRGGNGYKDSLKLAYEFDVNGDPGFTDSYLGIQFLGASVPYDSVNFVSWQFRNTADPVYFAPQTDIERYFKMQGYFAGSARYGSGVNPEQMKQASNRSMLITAGAIRNIAPGDSVNVVFAILAAKKHGEEPASVDNEDQKLNLYANAEWALRAYHGEDRNRNGVLDPGEDGNGDGKLTRYILPAPPRSPKVKAVNQSNKVKIYWDNLAESSVDPITGAMDFEGYRLYRTNAGFELAGSGNEAQSLVKMAEFDSSGNSLFYNTGFNYVRLNQPVKFDGDTTNYWYEFTVDSLLNGWQYLFAVTSFDKGDPVNRIESLESSSLFNLKRIVPGTNPALDAGREVGVYPNPYYGSAYWDGSSERLRKIYFYNLPENCEIIIYTLAGDIVKKLDHSPQSSGSDIRWFQNFSSSTDIQFSGGEHAWDLVTDNDQAIATGLYLFSVKDTKTGDIQTGKFLIVK